MRKGYKERLPVRAFDVKGLPIWGSPALRAYTNRDPQLHNGHVWIYYRKRS